MLAGNRASGHRARRPLFENGSGVADIPTGENTPGALKRPEGSLTRLQGVTPMSRQLAVGLYWVWYQAGISDPTLRTGTHLDITVDAALLRALLGDR